jgi:UTP--glucose-1-phosphate uridylyltransferase
VKAVIPAAGLGTRFLPATKSQPKEMLPIVDTPAIQYVVEECVQSGITDILIITGRGKRAIEDHFDRALELEAILERNGDKDRLAAVRKIGESADIHYIRQKEAKGLGHAIQQAETHVGDEPFLVLLGDDIVESQEPTLKQIIRRHNKHKGSIVAVEELDPNQVEHYGIIAPGDEVEDGLWDVKDLVEKPKPKKAPSRLGILGRYLLTPGIFEALRQTKPGRKGELQLTDALRRLRKSEPIWAHRLEGRRHDVGDKLGWLIANLELALKRPDLGPALKDHLKTLLP